MRIFICDNCKKEFDQPLDEEMYKDANGVWHVFDLCAPCRGASAFTVNTAKKGFYDKLIKKDK